VIFLQSNTRSIEVLFIICGARSLFISPDSQDHLRLKWKLEFYPVLGFLRLLGFLPRGASLLVSRLFAGLLYVLHVKLRRNALFNLSLAYPDSSLSWRKQVLGGVYANLARLLAEFSQIPKLTPQNISRHVIYDGFENYLAAKQRGRGVLFLTAHFGAWELCPVAHALHGHPLKFLVRPIDNPLVDQLVNSFRSRCGNQVIDKKNAVREIVRILKNNEALGILIDQNTTLDAGIFVDFFGIPACTTTSLATLALRTGATVLPGFLIWDRKLRKHRLRFEPPVEAQRTGDFQVDILLNTQNFNRILEQLIRKYPDQWLWVHRRWKTRPPGEKPLY
jgi:KDO2-lipid IV(A) lauroyltransferase